MPLLIPPVINVAPDRRDLLDYTGSNVIQTARYINPITHDFEVSATNHLMGQNAVDSEVILAVNTTLNSSVLNGFGQGFGSIKLITPDMQAQVLSTLNSALSNLIDNNSITMGAVSISNTVTGQISVSFNYINNTTGVSTPQQFIL